MSAQREFSLDAPLRQQAISTVSITKKFGRIPFTGTIQKYDAKRQWYWVVYEDGDTEEMTWPEVMENSPTWLPDDAAEVPAGRPPKLAKKLKTADVGAAAATAAAAAAAKAQQAPAQQPVNPSKTRSKQATAASAAASAGAESVASPANKRRKLGAAAAPASGPSSAKALAQGAGVDGVSKPAKAKDKPAAVSAAAAADAGKGSKAKPNAAAAAAGAAAASKPKPAKASKAASQPEQKAGSKSAQAAAGGSKLQQQQPPAGASGAGTSTAADQGPKQKKPRVPQPREIPALPVYHPAKVCEEEWRAQQDAYIADMAAIRRQALGARPPVLFKKVTKKGKGKNVEEWVPVFEATSEDLPLAQTAEEAKKLLKKTETQHVPGEEPFRRHVLPPHVMELLLQDDAEAGITAATAAMMKTRAASRKKSTKSSATASAAASGSSKHATAASTAEASAENTATPKGGKKAAAAAAAAATAAAGGEQAAKGAKKKGAAAAVAAPAGSAQAAKGSNKKSAAAAAAAAAVEEQAAKGAKKKRASAAAGDKPAEVTLADFQQPVLYVPMEVFGDPQGKLARAIKQTSRDYFAAFRHARVTEDLRVEQTLQEAKDQGLAKPAKNPSKRPDRVAESAMFAAGHKINDRGNCGHVPGLRFNQRVGLRALASVLGFQKSPMAGMVAGELGVSVEIDGTTHPKLQAVNSVVASGTYSANADGTDLIVYTGFGGCDLHGDKSQIEDQQLKGCNKHMLVNWALGLPVRYFRRNDDDSADTKTSLIYDGLYYITSCCVQMVDGKTNQGVKKRFKTFVYAMRRMPGQPESESVVIAHHKSVRTCKTKDGINLKLVPHATCKDISKGVEREGYTEVKASMLVPATNEVDLMLPPGLDPVEEEPLLLSRNDGRSWQADPRPFTYKKGFTYDAGIAPPAPPQLLLAGSTAAKSAAAAMAAAAAEGRDSGCGPYVSSQYPGAPLWNAKYVIQTQQEAADHQNGPHMLLKRLNGGVLPWTTVVKKGGKERIAVQQPNLQRVMIECGPWTGCALEDCPQRQVMRPLQYRLEVYKTKECGWGVRSWDTIYAGSFVCFMAGRIKRREDVGPNTAYGASAYEFQMAPRPDVDHAGKRLQQPEQEGKQAEVEGKEEDSKEDEGEDTWRSDKGRFSVCARDEGNVARFINHSCDPNLYVQPVLSGHTDTDHVVVGLFAAYDIPPFTALSYDYGIDYLKEQLEGKCGCEADCCFSKRKQTQQAKAAASAAASPAAAAAAAAAANASP